MPQQLIYTSAPRGLVPGRSGYCTVARSAAMREPLVLRLEQLSYYHHVSLNGGLERPIFACRLVDIRNTRFHVLSRVQDAGLDFTGRTNFIAHHLVFTPEEAGRLPVPAVMLRDWAGWLKSWAQEPQMLTAEDWSGLEALGGRTALPAQNWQRLTGDAVNGYGLLEARPGTCFVADGLEDEMVLSLLAESAELLEVRDARRDFRAAAWQQTFTTTLQEQDNPSDLRWRVVHSDNPVFARLGAANCVRLTSIRGGRCTDEEAGLARTGRRAPLFRWEPQDTKLNEGMPAKLQAKADGVPAPTYQWYAVDRAEKKSPIANQTCAELTLAMPPVGVSRYVVKATNSAGESFSRVAVVSIEPRLRVQRDVPPARQPELAPPGADYIKSQDDIDRQRNQLAAEKAEQTYLQKQRSKRLFMLGGIMILFLGLGWIFARHASRPKTPDKAPDTVRVDGPEASSGPTDSVGPQPGNPPQTAAVESNTTPVHGVQTENMAATGSSPEQAVKTEFKDNLSGPSRWSTLGKGEIAEVTTNTNWSRIYEVKGTGASLSTTPDDCFFAYQAVSNSMEFIAKVVPKAESADEVYGIMMRASSKPDAPFVFVGSQETNLVWIQRSAAGGSCTQTNLLKTARPLLIRLLRAHNHFMGYFLNERENWQLISECDKPKIGPEYLLGFAVASGRSDTTVEVQFGTVTIKKYSP